jgi:hypothetical protein
MGDQVPLTGPFVTQEEATNLAAAREAQRAENAASEKDKKVLRETRSTSELTMSSSEKPKASKEPTKGSKRKKSQTPQKEPTQSPSLQGTSEEKGTFEKRKDMNAGQNAAATADLSSAEQVPASVTSSSSANSSKPVVPVSTSGPTLSLIPLPAPGDGGITQAAVTRAPTSQADLLFQGFEAQLDHARVNVRSLRQQLAKEVAARAKTKQVRDKQTEALGTRDGRSLASENSLQGDKMRLMEQVSILEKRLQWGKWERWYQHFLHP